MKKLIFVFISLFFLYTASAQKYISKDAHIWFYSHTPMEDIEAHNHQVATILDISTGDLTFSLLMKSFEFKRALMQEHFNENYVESTKFPKASFKGKINNLQEIDFKKSGLYKVEVSGDLTLHGVTKKITTSGTLEVKSESIVANSKFLLDPKDFDIQIPSLVKDKIAREITVNAEINYKPFAK